MRRILINECKQEISSFNPVLAHYDDFLTDLGDTVLSYHRPIRSEVGGALQVFDQRDDLTIIGGYSARGITSSGPIAAPDFARISREFFASVQIALPLDGVYLALHGALASQDFDDAEGHLIEATRKIVGNDTPIVVSLDLHGILTDRILQHSDAVVVYHTNPHIDFYETGQRAARLLVRLLDKQVRPTQVRVPIPALVRGSNCITATGLIRGPLQRAIRFENSPGGVSGGIFIGNPFTDVPDLCSNVLLVTDGDSDCAIAEATAIANDFWALKEQIQQPLTSLKESIRLAAAGQGRVVLVDAADATSSGASGDSNAILAELLAAACPRTALIPIVDPPAVQACISAGLSATITTKVGGTLDPRFQPVTVTGQIISLSDGHLRSESHGEAWYAGPTAVLKCGPITLVITTRPVSLYDRTLFLANQQDPANFDMTVVKSPLCQPQFFNDGADLVLNIDAPGSTSANLLSLGHTQATRPLYPLDKDFSYTPAPRIFQSPRCR